MNTFDAMLRRRSIRSYTGKKIERRHLKTILKAAYASPAARGCYDSLHLTVIEDARLLKEIDHVAFEYMRYQEHPLHEAPTLILVSSAPIEQELGNAEYSNSAILVHSMGLAATDLEVGCCYIWGSVRALNENPELVAKLDLPEGFTPCCGIVLGVTDEHYTDRDIPTDRISTDFY